MRVNHPAEERLAEMMIRHFGLDVQVEARSFTRFLYLMLVKEKIRVLDEMYKDNNMKIRDHPIGLYPNKAPLLFALRFV